MRRIQRDTRHEELVKSLTTGEAPVFKEIWRLMLFAAALGVSQNRRVPLQKYDSGKGIPENYFSAAGWRGFLYLIGVADSGDSECLKGTDDAEEFLVKAFEEFANHGLDVIASRLKEGASELESMLALCLEANVQQVADVDLVDLI